MIDRLNPAPHWMFWCQISLPLLLFAVVFVITVIASITLNKTGVKFKWAIHLTMWSITIALAGENTMLLLIYVARNYHHSINITPSDLFIVRYAALVLHGLTIDLAIVLIIKHTSILNTKTIRLIRTLNLRKELTLKQYQVQDPAHFKTMTDYEVLEKVDD
jgi:hypothetical protein